MGDIITKPVRRQQPRTTDKKKLIETVAAELFARSGYDGVSLRDIAEAAEVQLGTLFYLYPEKQSLYDQVVANAIEHFGGRILDAVVSAKTAQGKIRSLIRSLVHEHALDSLQGQILARELAEGKDSRFAMLGPAMFRRLREALNPAVRELRGQVLAEAETDRLTGQLINMIYAATRSQSIYSGAFGAAERTEGQIAAELEDLVLNGLLPR